MYRIEKNVAMMLALQFAARFGPAIGQQIVFAAETSAHDCANNAFMQI